MEGYDVTYRREPEAVPAATGSRHGRFGVFLAALFGAGLGLTLVLLVPQVMQVYADGHLELPTPTVWVLTASSAMTAWWWIVLPIFVLQLVVLALLRSRLAARGLLHAEVVGLGLLWPLSATALLLPFLKLG